MAIVELLEEHGVTDEQLFEALQATEISQKINGYTSGLQLEAGLWAEPDLSGWRCPAVPQNATWSTTTPGGQSASWR